MKLVDPDKKYVQSWLAALDEFENNGELDSLGSSGLLINYCNPRDLNEYIEVNERFSNGIDLPDGRVPSSVHWLVDRDEFVGVADFRHSLNDNLRNDGGHIGYMIRPSRRSQGYGEQLLKLMKQKAKEFGVNKVLLTCNTDNLASKKIIEHNGGQLDSKYYVGDKEKLRYWIEL